MKLPFKKNNEDSGVPAEIQNYYQSERRERPGIAWLLALGTLLVTVVLVLGLFFGGRYIYRKVTDRNQPTTTQEQVETGSAPSVTDSTNTPDTPASDTTTSPGQTGTSSATTTVPSGSAVAPATTGNPANLPNTGPGTEE